MGQKNALSRGVRLGVPPSSTRSTKAWNEDQAREEIWYLSTPCAVRRSANLMESICSEKGLLKGRGSTFQQRIAVLRETRDQKVSLMS